MNTTIDYLKDYIKENYGLEFKKIFDTPTEYEKYESLTYQDGKKVYELSVGWAQSNRTVDNAEHWSIYHNFMDCKEWHGFGGAEMDNGKETIDKIMQDWGFKKQQEQLNIFDFIKEE